MAMSGALLLVACAQPAGKTGLSDMDEDRPEAGVIFRHRWWNYYIRALVAADNQDYGAAQTDLSNALKQRSRDQRMARTYDMHFIDYFPHREIGVLHWLGGNLKEAAAELSLSIEQAPSAKARYYLDLVRKALIQQRGGPIKSPQLTLDVPPGTFWSRADRIKLRGPIKPPQLTLDVPPGTFWSRADRIKLKGSVVDSNFVSDILIDGQSLHIEGRQTTVDFSHDLSLPQGCHAVSVEAVNLAGQRTRSTVNICVDRLGPSVVLDRIEPLGAAVLIVGAALDEAGVAELKIDGRQIPTSGKPETAFSFLLSASDQDTVIECQDVLGNRTTYYFTPTHLQATKSRRRLVAGLQLAGLFQPSNDRPPVLRVPGWQNSQTVYMQNVVLTGSVSDRDRIVSLTINGEALLPRPGALFFFSHIIDLSPGVNAVIIEAEDAAGNRSRHRLMIERKIPKGLLLEERLRLSVFAFEQKGRISPAGFAFQDNFIHEIVQHRRFQVVERRRLDLILQEQKINRTQLIDRDTAVRLGNLSAAQAIVAGSLVETRTGIEIIGRVVDTETAEILCTADVYGETKTLPGLKFLAQALALKLHREFPLVDGLVIDKQGDLIITDLTLEKLRAQRHILIYAEHPVFHPETKQSMGMDHEVLGGARVTQADDHLAKARLKTDSNPAIRPRHRVITQ